MDGIIVIDKQKGCTSHDIVYKVKKIFNKKVGHTGTLDPNATGVLPILVGKGTLLSKYLINHDKTYEVVLKLGEKTDTADSEGKVVETKVVKEAQISNGKIDEVLKSFIGKQKQLPPMYSAIKINGRKLYEYARSGEKVEVPARDIEIYNIRLIKIENLEIIFEVSCSKGTYIRSLCEDIAKNLNTVGYMKELRRTQVGEFSINDAIKLSELEENCKNKEFINETVISIEEAFTDKPQITLSNDKLKLFLNGVKLKYNLENGVYRIYNKDEFLGTGIINNNILKRDIIIDS